MARNFIIVSLLAAAVPLTAVAQTLRNGYVEKGVCGSDFPMALENWEKGIRWCDDDNFFISRVPLRERFRNTATQINRALTEENDKKLILWVPVNNAEFNALPDGAFDREVFPMWSYITHYGNWSAPLVRMPGGFADVAHKNGVQVSVVASVPFGNLTPEWRESLGRLTEAGAEKLADYLLYYGVDGIGYNSEFYCDASLVDALCRLHEETVGIMKASGRNPSPEFIWYDGTDETGVVNFDLGLGLHNRELWGYGENIRTSLFLNYNWNFPSLLSATVKNAQAYGRSPLDIYCGVNMQGREPESGKNGIWTLLEQWPLSIGLWGGHSENMFFESRVEAGSSPWQRQRTYLDRVMNWFTNSAHNPIAYHPTVNSLIYSAKNKDFSGMSKMMSARSALKWDLSEEPFITYFNLGNGHFLNYHGLRCHNSEWYNIAVQDYLPTWMWWFSTKLLGRETTDVAENGLQAEFTWDDAWNGGSTIRIHGSSAEEYLHLFKMEFPIEEGDEITFRYKLLDGVGNASLVMSLKGEEQQAADGDSMKFLGEGMCTPYGEWIERKFIVGSGFKVRKESTIALVALHFSNVSDLDMRLGEFSIKRPSALKASVDSPVIESSRLLSARYDGFDGKIIFHMPNDKGNDVCYNRDVNTSLFKLYSQQEDCQPVLMGMTTSWAGLMFAAPISENAGGNVRFGVSALALDHITESKISWGEWLPIKPCYEVADKIIISDSMVKPGERFSVGYADPVHEPADWVITDADGRTVAQADGVCSIEMTSGLATSGIYDLTVKGPETTGEGRKETVRKLKGFVQITDNDSGDIPVITSIQVADVLSTEIGSDGEKVYGCETLEPTVSYTIDSGEATVSRGVRIGENGLGFRFVETGLNPGTPFSVSFWFRPEGFCQGSQHLLNIRHKGDIWPVNTWGWFWHTLNEAGGNDEFTVRLASGDTVSYGFDGMRLTPGVWYHIAYVFRFDDSGNIKPSLFINGEKQLVTSRSVGGCLQPDETAYTGPVWGWNDGNVVAIGGSLHKTGSAQGNVDNLMVWGKALSPQEIATAMKDIDTAALPEGLVGFFDFEEEPDGEHLFRNTGHSSFKAGLLTYSDTEREGQGTLLWSKPEYCAGCPFISGAAFTVSPKVSWSIPGGKVTKRDDSPEGGYARLSYDRNDTAGRVYHVSVIASNEYGTDSRGIYISPGSSGVGTLKNGTSVITVFPTVFESEVGVVAPEPGHLSLSLFTSDGRRVLSNDFQTTVRGEILKIYPDVPPGLYLLQVERPGQNIGTVRVIRR